jgi:hypothetical protein
MPSVSTVCVTLCGTELTVCLTSVCVRASKYTKNNEIYILLHTKNAEKKSKYTIGIPSTPFKNVAEVQYLEKKTLTNRNIIYEKFRTRFN